MVIFCCDLTLCLVLTTSCTLHALRIISNIPSIAFDMNHLLISLYSLEEIPMAVAKRLPSAPHMRTNPLLRFNMHYCRGSTNPSLTHLTLSILT
ncbi:hypothetical protein F4801DRAFT_568124 [Xylaria longipes]|nr:hypothetical protein F4801DRAFT_568124 [Xylaria longipes]